MGIKISNSELKVIISDMYSLVDKGQIKKGNEFKFNELFKTIYKVIEYCYTASRFSGISYSEREDLTLDANVKIFYAILKKGISLDLNIHSYITTACYNCFNTMYHNKMKKLTISTEDLAEKDDQLSCLSQVDHQIPHQ